MSETTAPETLCCSNCAKPVRPAPNAWGWVHIGPGPKGQRGYVECCGLGHRAQVEVRGLGGINELARLSGQAPNTVAQQFRRGQLPEPVIVLAMGPVWAVWRESVQEWVRGRREVVDLTSLLKAMVAAGDLEGDDDPARAAARLVKTTTADEFARSRGWERDLVASAKDHAAPQAWLRLRAAPERA